MRDWCVRFLVLGMVGCGGGGHQSSAGISADGSALDSTWQTSGVDAMGTLHIVFGGDDWSVTIRVPSATTGTFSSAEASGGEILFTDADGTTFAADDQTAGAAYEVTIEVLADSSIEGTVTATVVAPDGTTIALEAGTFRLILPGGGGRTYQGTYIGIFSARGQIQTGTDPMTGEPIWGPMQVAGFRMTLELDHLTTADGTAIYTIKHANISDPFFGCNIGGCNPEGSFMTLPEPPGTPAPSGPSQEGHGMLLVIREGTTILTANGAGDLYTSSTGSTMGSALDVVDPWFADADSMDYLEARFGRNWYGLNEATRSATWNLTKSAL